MHVLLLIHRVIRNLAAGHAVGAARVTIIVGVTIVVAGGSRVVVDM